LIGRSHRGAPLDDALGQKTIARRVERLEAAPELETGGIARTPDAHEIVRIRRQKEIAVLRGEHRRTTKRVVVRSRDADDHETDRLCVQACNEWKERIHGRLV
jgi:hypothetical protein